MRAHRGLILLGILLFVPPPVVRYLLVPDYEDCPLEGRGTPPLHWLACEGAPGDPRPLSVPERLALGLPVDVNAAQVADLLLVPGISPRLANAIVDWRARHGPLLSVEDLIDVPGIGEKRLEQLRLRLDVGVQKEDAFSNQEVRQGL
jgi:competence ComEA-like helix-hairpin-helix protein